MTDGAEARISGMQRGKANMVLAFLVAFGLGVFAVPSAKAQIEDLVYSFGSFNAPYDAQYPNAGVIRDASGNLYGTTDSGGGYGCGTVFEVDASGKETVLYSFTGPDGCHPSGGLIMDTQGNLYGTTNGGGAQWGVLGGFGYGTVFKLDTSSPRQEAWLYSFDPNGIYGTNPQTGLVMDNAGFSYGATNSTVFKLDSNGNMSPPLHTSAGAEGLDPNGSLILDNVGYLYGTAYDGGINGVGTVFKVKTDGTNYTELWQFDGNNSGANPTAGLIMDQAAHDTGAGYLYGTTSQGGSFSFGTVFKLDTSGANYLQLHSFTGGPDDGQESDSPLVMDDNAYSTGAGNLYGTTYYGGGTDQGTVFAVDTGGNNYTVLHKFYCLGGCGDGWNPIGKLIMDNSGYIYGTTYQGGDYGYYGAVFVLGTQALPALQLSAGNSVNPSSVDFGSVAVGTTSAPLNIGLLNGGTADLNFTSITVSGDFAIDPTNSCSTSTPLPASNPCGINVTFSPTATGLASGTLTITDNATLGSENYRRSPQTVTLTGTGTGTQASLVITASTATMTYGGAVPVITPSYTPSNPAGLTTPPTCTTTATSSSPAGTYPSTCTGAVDANYTISYTAGTVTVTAASLSIMASSPSMTYGGTVPTITPSYLGFVNNETAASLTTAPTCSTTATTSSPVGTSPVTSCTGAVDANYTINYTPGTVTILAASLSITASSASMTYGGTPPTITPNYTGFVNGDTAASLSPAPTCSTTATSSSPAGTYPSNCTGAGSANYTISYTAGTVTVTAASLSITASSASMTYGGAVPVITPSYNPSNPAGLTTPPTCTTTATSSSPSGTYPTTCSGAVDANYTISYTAGTVTITAAPLTITASSPTMTYGGPVPAITPSFNGFVNGQNSSVLTAQPTCSTTATSTSPAGSSFPSSCAGAAAVNYAITYASGSVTVNKATSTTTITSHLPNPSQVGQAVTVSFAAAPQFSGTPNGSVTVTASTGQACSAALAGGAGSCQLTFTATGTPTLTASYGGDTNFLASFSAGVSQTVNPASSGAVSLSPTSLVFGNQLVGTTSTAQTVRLTNVGSTALAISSISWSGDFTGGTNCGTSLAAGAGCNINVRFKPTAAGLRTGTVTITDSDPTSPQTVALSGTGVAPINSVSPLALTFSSPLNIASASQPVTVTNTGTAPLIINGITIGGTNPLQFRETNTCGTFPATLAVNATCTINVTFLPTAASPLTKTALLRVAAAAPATTVSVSLTGTIIVPTYSLSSTSLAFGNQPVNTTSAAQTVTLTNGASASLTINNIVLGGTSPLQFAETNTCGTFPVTLAANDTCTISVTFHPTTTGAKSASVAVRVAAPAANQSISLTGTGQ